jgi:hypothetical protein
MFKFAFIFISFSSLAALAHVEPGTYKGKTLVGDACEMTAGQTFFEGAKPPLSERIKIKVGTSEFTVGHPPVISVEQSLASFNHDLFQGVLPAATGASALVVDMVHTQTQEGPTSFALIENDWKAGTKKMLKCNDIKLVRD